MTAARVAVAVVTSVVLMVAASIGGTTAVALRAGVRRGDTTRMAHWFRAFRKASRGRLDCRSASRLRHYRSGTLGAHRRRRAWQRDVRRGVDARDRWLMDDVPLASSPGS